MFEKKTEGSSKYRCINAYYLISSGKISPDVQYKEIVDIKPWTRSIEPLMLLLTTIITTSFAATSFRVMYSSSQNIHQMKFSSDLAGLILGYC